MEKSYSVSDVNRVRRVAKRGAYDEQTVHRIIDQALIGHVGILNEENQGVAVIPMIHARRENSILFHGATSSRLMKYLGSGNPVCVSFAMVDGLVLAKSLFHHSMNYRSAVVFGSGSLLQDDEDKLRGLKIITDKIMPGRWDDARLPSAKELAATAVVAVEIQTASAKIREGGPMDDDEDLQLPVWSGVIPITSYFDQPLSGEHTADETKLPKYLTDFIANESS